MVKKILCLVIVSILLFPAIKGNVENNIAGNKENYSPVALINGEYKGIVGEAITFNASSSYDPNGDKLYYRWDFDNDGVYDTPWLSSPFVKHVYDKPYNGFVRLQVKDARNGIDECITKVIVTNGKAGIDQKQEKADGYVEIYGDKMFAQTFKPSMLRLEGLDIYVARNGIIMPPFLSKFLFGRLADIIKGFFLGDLSVGIYEVDGDNIQGKYITGHTFKADEITKSGGWIHIDFGDGIDLRWNKTYSIVVYQTGGNERNYYKWYYGNGDLYENGMFYEKVNGKWNGDIGRDFCFRTYAELSGDEPDGVAERWAVLIGVLNTSSGLADVFADKDVYDEKNCLISHGWEADHIKTLISPTIKEIEAALDWMAKNDDADDAVDMVTWSAHGGHGYFLAYDGRVSANEIDFYLDKCSAKGYLVVANTCHSGSIIPYLAQDGRVILTSSSAQKLSYKDGVAKNSIFFYYLFDPEGGAFWKKSLDTNNDGWISAEEAFPYAKEKTNDCQPYDQDPQMFDGYPTRSDNSAQLLISHIG